MPRQYDLHAHFRGAPQYAVEIIDLEPEQHPVPVRPVSGVPEPAVVMLSFKTVELKNQLAAEDQLLILRAAVIASTPEKALVPFAARAHIADSDQRLGPHSTTIQAANSVNAK